MRLSTKVAYNTIVQFAGKIIATGLGLATVALITRYLGQEGFGEYTTAITFLSFFAIIADLGLTLVTVQMISRPGADEPVLLGNLLSLRLFTAIILLGIAPLIVMLFPYGPAVKMAVGVAAASFIFIALNQILVGLFQKHLRLEKVSIAEVVSRLVLLAATILSIRYDYGLSGIIAATVFASAVNFGLHFLFSRSLVRFNLRFDLAVYKDIILRSWPLAITIILNLIYLKADTLILSLLPRQSQLGIIAEVGIYGAAYKVIDVVITFPFMFAGIILPILTAAWIGGDREKYRMILQKAFDVMVILAVPLVIGTQLIAREAMVFVAGNDFAVSGPVLQILIGAAGIIFLGIMFSHAVIALGKQKHIIGAYLFVAMTAVFFYLYAIPRYSYFGAAWGTIYSELAIALASFYIVWKYSHFLPQLTIFIKSLSAALIMAVAIWLVKSHITANLIAIFLIALAVYFPLIYFFRGLTRQDMMDLLNKTK